MAIATASVARGAPAESTSCPAYSYGQLALGIEAASASLQTIATGKDAFVEVQQIKDQAAFLNTVARCLRKAEADMLAEYADRRRARESAGAKP